MEIDQKNIKAALKLMVKEGTVWAKCPKCNIPLSIQEYSKSKCGTCGKIEMKNIAFFPKSNMC